jgi:hypothetical protein
MEDKTTKETSTFDYYVTIPLLLKWDFQVTRDSEMSEEDLKTSITKEELLDQMNEDSVCWESVCDGLDPEKTLKDLVSRGWLKFNVYDEEVTKSVG